MEHLRAEISQRIKNLHKQLLHKQLQGQSPLVNPSALNDLAQYLETSPGSHEVIERLKDPEWLGKLVAYSPVHRAGAAYIVPGLVAWTALAMAEYLFSQTDPAGNSFFGWWSRQGFFSPMTYSLGVAACLAWLVGKEWWSGWEVRRQHDASALVDATAIQLAILTSQQGRTPSTDMAAAAEQLTTAAGLLDDLVKRFAQAEVGIKKTQEATAKAIEAARSIETASASLALPANRLAESLTGLQPLLGSWTATRGEVSGVVERLGSTGTQVENNLTELRSLAAVMLSTAKENSTTAIRLQEMVRETASAQPSVQASAEAMRKVGESLQKSQDLLAKMVRDAAILVGIADTSKHENRG